MRNQAAIITSIAASWTAAVNAEPLPPPIKQQLLDSRGVGIKNGRLDGLSVPLISVGGDGSAALDRSYTPQDGRELLVKSVFNVRQSRVYDTPFHFFEHETVTYPGGSITFRKISDVYVEEHKTGASLTYQNNSFRFIDKFGVKIEGDKITYPDGREVWGGTATRDLVSPVLHQVNEMRNNFGYRLRTSGEITQAINMAVDYCGFDYNSICRNLSFKRSARVQQNLKRYSELLPTSDIILTNSSNEVTRIKLNLKDIFYQEPVCSAPKPKAEVICLGNKFPFYYPESVVLPGSAYPNILLTYSGSGYQGSVTHQETTIDTVNTDGVVTDYDVDVFPYAGGGSSNYPPPGNQISVKAKTGGVLQLYAHSYNYGVVWPSSNLELRHIADGLNRTFYYAYNEMGDVKFVSFPDGNGISYDFDNRFNVTKITNLPKGGSNQVALTTTYEYPAACSVTTQAVCNLPVSMTDPRGNRTDYTYNSRGQLQTETGPAPSSGAPRPRTTNTYTLRTAFIKDANGNTVAAGSPISLLTRSSKCMSTTSCGGTLDEVVTDYDYGPTSGLNNMNLRGVAVTAINSTGVRETLRTCYRYNYFGEKISETKPSAAVASCSAL
jgi:YD repeat-containing protein